VSEDRRAQLEHDLKTPLSVIAGYAELLSRRDDDETRLAAAEQIAAAAIRLGDAIDGLLGLDDARAARPAFSDRFSGSPARIVVIDDDVFVRHLLRTTLPTETFEIMEAGNGNVALALMEIEPPDLVVLDWKLPEVSGETVLRETKRRHADVAVVVLTADPRQRGRAAELGADAFLTKPFSPLELLATIDGLLDEPPAGDGPAATASVT
jgi:CheY-like chemotaxis protein